MLLPAQDADATDATDDEGRPKVFQLTEVNMAAEGGAQQRRRVDPLTGSADGHGGGGGGGGISPPLPIIPRPTPAVRRPDTRAFSRALAVARRNVPVFVLRVGPGCLRQGVQLPTGSARLLPCPM